jgi:hypothetical protein|tara:strand:+ start:137 stop:1150 length:1014 start_codon:yes stop_codon:yes gene_type:complete
MASNVSFSPKEFTVLIRPQTEWGETEAGTDMYQLDVDSVSMPSLGLNQSIDLRNTSGRTFSDEDFFQDNKMTVREMTFTGNFHTDAAHKFPFLNLSNQATSNDTVPFAAGHQPQNLGNGVSISAGTMASHHLFTIAIAAPETTNAKHMLFHNCVCTNFQISADIGTDGGRYKYSATFSTGGNYQALASTTSVAPSSSYSNTTNVTMGGINASTLKVADINATLNSFSVTVDFPAIWTGAGSLGYEVCNRAQECSITFDAQIKYDNLTDELINTFDGQSAAVDGVGLNIVNSANFDIAINDYILTNVAFNESDLMMLDVSGKALDDGSEALLVLDWAS